MVLQHKKIFPKIKKNFKKFLTDESGKITKNNALGLSAGIVLFSAAEEASAYHHSVTEGPTGNQYHHNVANVATYHSNAGPIPLPDANYAHLPWSTGNYTENFEVQYVTTSACKNIPGINQTVNGHFS